MPTPKTARERLEKKRRRRRNRLLQEKLTKNQHDGLNVIQAASMDPDDDDSDMKITEDEPNYDL